MSFLALGMQSIGCSFTNTDHVAHRMQEAVYILSKYVMIVEEYEKCEMIGTKQTDR